MKNKKKIPNCTSFTFSHRFFFIIHFFVVAISHSIDRMHIFLFVVVWFHVNFLLFLCILYRKSVECIVAQWRQVWPQMTDTEHISSGSFDKQNYLIITSNVRFFFAVNLHHLILSRKSFYLLAKSVYVLMNYDWTIWKWRLKTDTDRQCSINSERETRKKTSIYSMLFSIGLGFFLHIFFLPFWLLWLVA